MKIAIPLQTGKSLENLVSALKLILLMMTKTMSKINKEKLTPIQRPSKEPSNGVA